MQNGIWRRLGQGGALRRLPLKGTHVPQPYCVCCTKQSPGLAVTQGRRAQTRLCLCVDMKEVHVGYSSISHGPQSHCTPQHNAVMGRSKSYMRDRSPSFLVFRDAQWAHIFVSLHPGSRKWW